MASEKLEVVVTADDKASKVLSSIGNAAGGLLKVGIMGAAAAAAALAAGMGFAINEAMGFQDASAQLTAVLESTGGAAGVTYDAAMKLATGLSTVTKFSEEENMAAESMLLTFTNIGKDVFPQATEAVLNIATAMGTDAKGAAIQIGKALNDPIKGITALTRVGVTFNDEQRKMISNMVEAGDVAGAQAIILAELDKEFGNSARAAGETFGGQVTILKNGLSEMAESIGMAVMPSLTTMLSGITSFVSSEQFSTWVQNVCNWLTTNLPIALQWVSNVWTTIFLPAITAVWTWMSTVLVPFFQNTVLPFFQTYVPIALQFLATVWTTVLQPAIQAVWNWLSTVLMPFIQNVIVPWLQVNIPIALKFLSDVWTNVLKPAIQAVWNWISTVLIPFFQNTVAPWLQEKIPVALEFLSDVWQNVLKPAIQAVWNWLSTVLIPFFQNVVFPWLQEKIPAAIKTLSDFWTNTLKPAIEIVWNFISTSVIPLFTALVNLISAVLGVALTALAGLWQNVLQPALKIVWDFISDKINPIIQAVSDLLESTLGPAIDKAGGALGIMKGIFDGISSAIQTVIGWIQSMIDKLSDIKLPKWLTPGSPTPFEIGLQGIAAAMKDIAIGGIPSVQSNVNALGAKTGVSMNNSQQTSIVLNASYAYQPQEDVARSIRTLAMLYGVS